MNNANGLTQLLVEGARGKGICAHGYKRMCGSDIAALIDYYIANPDWCLERDFPSLSVLEKHFRGCEDKGVFVGRTFCGELLNDLQTYIFHKCSGTIKVGLNVEKAIIPMLYLANGCRLRIVGVGDAMPKIEREKIFVPIYTFGDNEVNAQDNEYVKFIHFDSDLI